MDHLSQHTKDVMQNEHSSSRRSISELQADLFWRPNLPKTCTVADAHKACLELLERQLTVVLDCAKEGNTGVKSLLYPIARKLDDQMVRFEIWSSDVDAKTGTLGEEPVVGAFSDDMNMLFGLVKDRLLKILELAGIVSDDLSAVFGVLGTLDNISERETAVSKLQDPCDHVSSTISEIDPVLRNLNNLVRPVRAAQAKFRQEGSYWEHRQKILQVKNAGRSAGPSGLPSPSPSRASDESPNSTGYPDRSTRPETYSEGSDKGKSLEGATRSLVIMPESSAHPTLTSRAAGKGKGIERTRQGRSPESVQISMACPTDRLKAKLDMLVEHHFHDDDWMDTLDDRISVVLDEESLKAMFTCSCTRCRLSRRLAISSSGRNMEGLRLDGISDALRLLAMCTLAEKPFLISILLSRDVDDEVFDEIRSETQLVDDTGIALEDARLLLRLKGLFFGVSIMRYLRSARKDDKPQDGERTWLLNEILELTRKLSSPNDALEQELQDLMIGQLTFATSRRMATDRLNEFFPELWDDQMSIQSLGFLIMDMIWFLVDGSSMVMYMDGLRSRPTSRPPQTAFDWIKRISKEAFAKLESEPELAQAFEVAYILIQPTGRFGLDGTPEENYAYADLHLRKLWPVELLEEPVRIGGHRRNTSLDNWIVSTKGSVNGDTADMTNYVEMEGNVFKWLILRFKKEGDQEIESGCRIRIYRSPSGQRVRFVVCDFEKDPNRHTSFQALMEGLCFVPLYSYDNRPTEFSAKLQPKSGSTKDINIPFIFTFQCRDDVQLFQESLTSRTIEIGTVLNSLSVVIKKYKGLEIKGFEIGFWDSKREELRAPSFGAMQIWKVLERDKLDLIHQREEQQKRGVKDHPLRFEIALSSERMLLVIGVRSLLRVRDLDNLGLSITSRDDARASTLIGRLYQAQKLDDETIFPGIPVFQKPPFESPQDGQMILCRALRLGFSSKLARDNMRRFLTKNYNAKPF